MWNERKYLQAITKASKSLKRKASEANTARITAVSKKNVAVEDDTDYDDKVYDMFLLNLKIYTSLLTHYVFHLYFDTSVLL